jgi:hypothetical protein
VEYLASPVRSFDLCMGFDLVAGRESFGEKELSVPENGTRRPLAPPRVCPPNVVPTHSSSSRFAFSRHIVVGSLVCTLDFIGNSRIARPLMPIHREAKMTEEHTSRGRTQDRARVAAGQDHEVRYEARKEGISREDVKQAVHEVGNSRKKVEARLEAGEEPD